MAPDAFPHPVVHFFFAFLTQSVVSTGVELLQFSKVLLREEIFLQETAISLLLLRRQRGLFLGKRHGGGFLLLLLFQFPFSLLNPLFQGPHACSCTLQESFQN